ncbi:Cytoplasmic tRNA 2-thiolation protein 1 [Neolecta irregularis DAH-3]|uniref:Cytoplasmic tRNA 2-thiolation protein 1 n=1 Tax=Neolecta irregularis (strain DAH-3) TaxID=1198029 RepID=A0A1U7LV33_NEOID|nr:Cytoplasmic tRNA 2-thiolation protein 1 [Neolecta irregularis DAH-3]|eukprot:OLL26536.1 Cytoplasmic tRNA 2-thiolation protein 1 [Neolecta irregularis DAH-3]
MLYPTLSNSSMSASIKNPCQLCDKRRALLKRPKTSQKLCKECFYHVFETEIHNTIKTSNLFQRDEKIGMGASGGKDSTVLAYVMKKLNDKYNYGVELVLISVDEGIKGYRDDSLETVKRNQIQYDLPLTIVSYKDLYGWSMDDIVAKIGKKNNCTYCGVFRRQALDRAAEMLGCSQILTGHNADDIAETILMNLLRGDASRLHRCTELSTSGSLPRSKPFKFTYEKEIVMYAYHKKLDYFSTECIYSPEAFRGTARILIKDLEAIRPSAIIDIIRSGESMRIKEERRYQVLGKCERCGYASSGKICKSCMLLEGLGKIVVDGDVNTETKNKPITGLRAREIEF